MIKKREQEEATQIKESSWKHTKKKTCLDCLKKMDQNYDNLKEYVLAHFSETDFIN